MIPQELLDMLFCPACRSEGKQIKIDHPRPNWLVCPDCGRKYPIVDDIPVMLIPTGDKWQPAALADLPETPALD